MAEPGPESGTDLASVVHDLLGRVDALEAENRHLRASAVEPPVGPDDAKPAAAVSRRGLMVGAAGVAAMGVVGLVATAGPASANADGQSLTLGDLTNTATHGTKLTSNETLHTTPAFAAVNPSSAGVGLYGSSHGTSGLTASGAGVAGDSDVYPGVTGFSGNGFGVYGISGSPSTLPAPTAGVHGESAGSPGVGGTSDSSSGVLGTSKGSSGMSRTAGVSGDSSSNPGVSGTSDSGSGVYGASSSGTGVTGFKGASGFNGVAGVLGEGNGNYGVAAFSRSQSGVRAASSSAEGIRATSASGVGGSFGGGRAAVNLVPTGATGRPTSGGHVVGDLVVDHVGSLYLCTVAGTPGTWVKVTVSPA